MYSMWCLGYIIWSLQYDPISCILLSEFNHFHCVRIRSNQFSTESKHESC
jgi:hypothetical protein